MLKLCLADVIHNFKWLEIIRICQNGGQLFWDLADRCHVLPLTSLQAGVYCVDKEKKKKKIILSGSGK